MRRPSPALVVALIALFVALGGPANAARLVRGSQIKKNTITSMQIKNRSLGVKDLSRGAVSALRITPDGSITEAKLADGAVTSAKLGGAAVTGAKIAAGAIGGIQVADHSLTASDIARFSGTFTSDVDTDTPMNNPSLCWSRRIDLGADLSNAIVAVTPGTAWPFTDLTFTTTASSSVSGSAPDGFTVSGCSRTGAQVMAPNVVFRYIVFQN
jgi:hypothetical protein